MDVKICVCLPGKYGRFMLLIDNNLLLPGARLGPPNTRLIFLPPILKILPPIQNSTDNTVKE
jgi:hypothetical protein